MCVCSMSFHADLRAALVGVHVCWVEAPLVAVEGFRACAGDPVYIRCRFPGSGSSLLLANCVWDGIRSRLLRAELPSLKCGVCLREGNPHRQRTRLHRGSRERGLNAL